MRPDLKKRARLVAKELPLPRVLFEYSVVWGSNYRAIFIGEPVRVAPPESVLDEARTSGRVLLCGRAGSGKSVILRQLAKQASDKGSFVVFIDLSRWVSADASTIAADASDPLSCINFMVTNFSGLDATLLDLDMLSPHDPKVIFVDGLNEVPARIGAIVLRAADDAVKRLINASVIVADRLSRREISEDRWRLARVEPLSNTSIKKALGHSRPNRLSEGESLLDWPFFLARAIDDGEAGASGAAALRQFFVERVRLSDHEMDSVAGASYAAYVESKSRMFDVSKFQQRVGNEAMRKLIDAGAIEIAGNIAHFKHHLHHDFLAAMHVAEDDRLWGYTGFNALSFQGSAFDSIALAFAQVSRESKAAFVRMVYDWNPYAISFALAEDEYRERDDIDWHLECVVLSMLAEKRWDPIIPTAERAVDALSLFTRNKSSKFLDAPSLHALLTFISGFQSNVSWFNEWRSFFCIESADVVKLESIERLADTDSIVGWTLANVLKRFKLNRDQLTCVIAITRNGRPEVRWRAVHVLGACSTIETAAVVFSLLDNDEDEWVRYGAIRSLVEMAALSEPPIRKHVLKGLADRFKYISSNSKLRDELVRAMRIRPTRTSGDWWGAALMVLAVYLEGSANIEETDYWARAMHQLRADQAASRK